MECSASARIRTERLLLPRAELRRLGSRKHDCRLLSDACLWNRQYVLDARKMTRGSMRALLRMGMREVHVGWKVTSLAQTGLFRMRTRSDSRELRHANYSGCVPLVWWPMWGYSFADFFQHSVNAISELLQAGVIDRDVVLAPEVGGWRLVDFQLRMLGALTQGPTRTTAQIAPRCSGSRTCPPRCFSRLLLCRFKDVYDLEVPVAPFKAAHRMLPSLLLEVSFAESRKDPFTVIFANRTRTHHGARQIKNLNGLVDDCRGWRPAPQCGATHRTSCEAHNFGHRGLRADITRMQRANVLVGTHGAALIHALFMKPGSSLIEIRPYHFDGRWPDSYHYAMAQQENMTRIFVIRTTNRSLCSPIPNANVSAWDARPLDTYYC
ncbi:MAG: hypothetical protein SGPRY_000734 [Prymnesium sp.]